MRRNFDILKGEGPGHSYEICIFFKPELQHFIPRDLKVSSSQAKIDENFSNYFLKTKAKIYM